MTPVDKCWLDLERAEMEVSAALTRVTTLEVKVAQARNAGRLTPDQVTRLKLMVEAYKAVKAHRDSAKAAYETAVLLNRL